MGNNHSPGFAAADEALALEGVEDPEMIKQVEACIKIIKRSTPTHFVERPYRKWDARMAAGETWTFADPMNPDDPLLSEEQVILLHAWKEQGYTGVAGAIKGIIEHIIDEQEEQDKLAPKTYRDFISNYFKYPHRLYSVLVMIPARFMEPVIKGTLPAFINQNERLKLKLSAKATPGAYLNYAAYVPLAPSSQQTALNLLPDAGKWMSGEALEAVVEMLTLYIDDDPTKAPARRDLAKKMDVVMPGYQYKKDKYRHCKNQDQHSAIEEWIGLVCDIYIACLDKKDPLWKLPIAKCLAECGWSHNVATRLPAHTTETTAIFGAVVSAWTVYSEEHDEPMQPGLHQYHVLKAPYVSTAAETEITLTFLSGARLEECGYNYNPPGNMGLRAGYESFYAQNRLERFSTREALQDRTESHERALKYAEMCKKLETIDTDEQEIRQKQDTNIQNAKRVIEQLKAIEKARNTKKIASIDEIVADYRLKYAAREEAVAR